MILKVMNSTKIPYILSDLRKHIPIQGNNNNVII